MINFNVVMFSKSVVVLTSFWRLSKVVLKAICFFLKDTGIEDGRRVGGGGSVLERSVVVFERFA